MIDFINKAWWIATLSLLVNQFIDVTYYDIRISMIFGFFCRIKLFSCEEESK